MAIIVFKIPWKHQVIIKWRHQPFKKNFSVWFKGTNKWKWEKNNYGKIKPLGTFILIVETFYVVINLLKYINFHGWPSTPVTVSQCVYSSAVWNLSVLSMSIPLLLPVLHCELIEGRACVFVICVIPSHTRMQFIVAILLMKELIL